MAIRVYRYGLLSPDVNGDLINKQFELAHKYRNKLIEIERERRHRSREVLAAHGDMDEITAKITPLQERIEAMRTAIGTSRASTRTRSESPDARKQVRELQAEVKVLNAERKVIRSRVAADPEIQVKLKEIRDYASARRRDERKKCGVYWGTYLLVEAAHDAACKAVEPPRFVRWHPNGSIGVLLMNGIDAKDLYGSDTKIQIDPLPPEAFEGSRVARRTKVRMRIGSDDNHKPIWGEWKMIMHRPLPEGCQVKNVRISRHMINSTQARWSIHLTIDAPDSARIGRPMGEGMVALNLAWSTREDGQIRAGYLVGDDGEEHEVIVPSSVTDRVEKSESIQSFRDRDIDKMRPLLTAWVDSMWEKMPPWLVEQVSVKKVLEEGDAPAPRHAIYAWKSAQRFTALANRWKKNRWEGDDAGFEIIENWRYRDQHLEHYASGMRRHALGHRREVYRVLAAKLIGRYSTIIVDDTDLRKFQRSPSPESERVEIAAAKRNMRFAAGSELRDTLLAAFKRPGARIMKFSAVNITRCCNACGHVHEERPEKIMHACVGCGRSWDRDANAALNLLRMARQEDATPPADDSSPTSAPEIKETRSQRLRRGRTKVKPEAEIVSP